MRKNNPVKTVFKVIVVLFLVTTSFYLGKFQPAIFELAGLGAQNLNAQNLGSSGSDFQRFGLLFESLRYLKQHFVEQVEVDGNKELVYGSIRGMLRSLDDDYTRFISPEAYKNMEIDTKGKFGGIGIYIGIRNDTLTVISPLEDTPAQQVGLKSGDLITKIDGVSTEDMAIEDAVARIRGNPGDPVVLTIWRPGFEDEGKDFTIVRDEIKLKSVDGQKMLEDQVGYIRLTSFSEQTAPSLKEYILELKKKNAKGLILDLRGNPGGLLESSIEVASLFMDEGPVVHRVGRGRSKDTRWAFKDRKVWDGPMAILVDRGSASASEIVSGALQDNGIAAIIGDKTFGKGLVQTVFNLSDGSAIIVTTDKYYTSKMRDINKKGIVPDIVVKLDPRTGQPVEVSNGKKEAETDHSKVKKFPLHELQQKIRKDPALKDAGVMVYNGFPREDMYFRTIGGKRFIDVNDIGTLMGANVKYDEKTNVLELRTEALPENSAEADLKDAQLQRAIQYIKEEIAAGAGKKEKTAGGASRSK